MSIITIDPTTLSLLSQVKDVAELRDKDGNVVGFFTPKAKSDEEIKKLFDLDKARKKLASEKTRPFREMIDELDKLAEKQG